MSREGMRKVGYRWYVCRLFLHDLSEHLVEALEDPLRGLPLLGALLAQDFPADPDEGEVRRGAVLAGGRLHEVQVPLLGQVVDGVARDGAKVVWNEKGKKINKYSRISAQSNPLKWERSGTEKIFPLQQHPNGFFKTILQKVPTLAGFSYLSTSHFSTFDVFLCTKFSQVL